MSDRSDILDRIRALRTYRSKDRRAPHKPLLILYAVARLQHGERKLSFENVERALSPLLTAYAPPVKSGRHQPELPYWHLATDGLWVVDNAANLERQASGFPTMAALRKSSAALSDDFADHIKGDDTLLQAVVKYLLEEHFAPSTHEDILNTIGIGLEFADADSYAEQDDGANKRRRDPQFREHVLRAYEYRCAFSGFRAALNGSFFGCEAAYVRWHSHDGPDDLSNGIALEPTIHKLFDAGAWSLTDDRRIVVSKHLTGTDETITRIRGHHGKPLRMPLPGEPVLSDEFIQWHREPDLGGVFRSPALPL